MKWPKHEKKPVLWVECTGIFCKECACRGDYDTIESDEIIYSDCAVALIYSEFYGLTEAA